MLLCTPNTGKLHETESRPGNLDLTGSCLQIQNKWSQCLVSNQNKAKQNKTEDSNVHSNTGYISAPIFVK